MTELSLPRKLGLFIVLLLLTPASFAREPYTTHSYQPGVSLGIPIAAWLPPGLYYWNESNFYSSRLTAINGPSTVGQPTVESFAEVMKLIWASPYTFFGAHYLALLIQPFVVVHVASYQPYQSGLEASYVSTTISPVILSWQPLTDFYVSAVLTFNLDDAPYNKYDYVRIPNNYWAFVPELSFTYLTSNTNLTLHLLYSIDSTNHAVGYRSGSQIFADVTATKTHDNFEAGLVGYYDKQVTQDHNSGRFYPLGVTETRPMQLAVGPLLGYTYHKIKIQVYGTQDVIAEKGALKGYRVFSRVAFPTD